tara:strand:+ start:1414 stop:1644 length:231 start_codon:yes stop_codon:yes gene_type:complete
MEDYIAEMYKMVEYLTEKEKTEWVDLLHGMIIYIEEHENFETESESDTNYSEEEGNAIPEGVPEVNIDPSGFHSLV